MPKKTSRKYLRKSIRRNRKLSKKKQSYKKKSHKRKNTFKRKMIKRNLKLGGMSYDSREILKEIKRLSGKIKSKRDNLWTKFRDILTKEGFKGIDARGKLFRNTDEGGYIYYELIEDYLEQEHHDRLPHDLQADIKFIKDRRHQPAAAAEDGDFRGDEEDEEDEDGNIKTLSAKLQTEYQNLQNSREARPVLPTQRGSDYQPKTSPYSDNPGRTPGPR